MNVVADTNIFLAVAMDKPEKGSIVRLTRSAHIDAPEILPNEIGNALTAMYKRQQITFEQAPGIYQLTKTIPVRLVPVDTDQALETALAFQIHAYDAYFVQTALMLQCPLLTLDKQMQRIGKELGNR